MKIVVLLATLFVSSPTFADKYDSCWTLHKGDLDRYHNCLENDQARTSEESKVKQDAIKIEIKKHQAYLKKNKTMSISKRCSETFGDAESGFSRCLEVYSECSDDIDKAPATAKQGKEQADCISAINEKAVAEKQRQESEQRMMDHQAEIDRQQTEFQRQQLANQEQQQRFQMYNAIMGMHSIQNQPIQQIPAMPIRRATTTNCMGVYNGINCTTY